VFLYKLLLFNIFITFFSILSHVLDAYLNLRPQRQVNQSVDLQMLMGGGGSFSAGGPGKGMHSRLCMPLFKSLFFLELYKRTFVMYSLLFLNI